MVVLTNGVYKNVQGMWVFIGDKRADNFRFATSPFVGHWGSIDYIGNDRVLGTGTFRHQDGERSRGGVRLMVGRLNRSKTIAKGDVQDGPRPESRPGKTTRTGSSAKRPHRPSSPISDTPTTAHRGDLHLRR